MILFYRGVDCSTNGVCKDGLCLCRNGFTGKNCEIDVQVILKTLRDLYQELDSVKNEKRLCERHLLDLQPMRINPTEEVLKPGSVDGTWSEWRDGYCSKSCSRQGEPAGTITRYRNCLAGVCEGDHQLPGGRTCNGWEEAPCPL